MLYEVWRLEIWFYVNIDFESRSTAYELYQLFICISQFFYEKKDMCGTNK